MAQNPILTERKRKQPQAGIRLGLLEFPTQGEFDPTSGGPRPSPAEDGDYRTSTGGGGGAPTWGPYGPTFPPPGGGGAGGIIPPPKRMPRKGDELGAQRYLTSASVRMRQVRAQEEAALRAGGGSDWGQYQAPALPTAVETSIGTYRPVRRMGTAGVMSRYPSMQSDWSTGGAASPDLLNWEPGPEPEPAGGAAPGVSRAASRSTPTQPAISPLVPYSEDMVRAMNPRPDRPLPIPTVYTPSLSPAPKPAPPPRPAPFRPAPAPRPAAQTQPDKPYVPGPAMYSARATQPAPAPTPAPAPIQPAPFQPAPTPAWARPPSAAPGATAGARPVPRTRQRRPSTAGTAHVIPEAPTTPNWLEAVHAEKPHVPEKVKRKTKKVPEAHDQAEKGYASVEEAAAAMAKHEYELAGRGFESTRVPEHLIPTPLPRGKPRGMQLWGAPEISETLSATAPIARSATRKEFQARGALEAATPKIERVEQRLIEQHGIGDMSRPRKAPQVYEQRELTLVHPAQSVVERAPDWRRLIEAAEPVAKSPPDNRIPLERVAPIPKHPAHSVRARTPPRRDEPSEYGLSFLEGEQVLRILREQDIVGLQPFKMPARRVDLSPGKVPERSVDQVQGERLQPFKMPARRVDLSPDREPERSVDQVQGEGLQPFRVQARRVDLSPGKVPERSVDQVQGEGLQPFRVQARRVDLSPDRVPDPPRTARAAAPPSVGTTLAQSRARHALSLVTEEVTRLEDRELLTILKEIMRTAERGVTVVVVDSESGSKYVAPMVGEINRQLVRALNDDGGFGEIRDWESGQDNQFDQAIADGTLSLMAQTIAEHLARHKSTIEKGRNSVTVSITTAKPMREMERELRLAESAIAKEMADQLIGMKLPGRTSKAPSTSGALVLRTGGPPLRVDRGSSKPSREPSGRAPSGRAPSGREPLGGSPKKAAAGVLPEPVTDPYHMMYGLRIADMRRRWPLGVIGERYGVGAWSLRERDEREDAMAAVEQIFHMAQVWVEELGNEPRTTSRTSPKPVSIRTPSTETGLTGVVEVMPGYAPAPDDRQFWLQVVHGAGIALAEQGYMEYTGGPVYGLMPGKYTERRKKEEELIKIVRNREVVASVLGGFYVWTTNRAAQYGYHGDTGRRKILSLASAELAQRIVNAAKAYVGYTDKEVSKMQKIIVDQLTRDGIGVGNERLIVAVDELAGDAQEEYMAGLRGREIADDIMEALRLPKTRRAFDDGILGKWPPDMALLAVEVSRNPTSPAATQAAQIARLVQAAGRAIAMENVRAARRRGAMHPDPAVEVMEAYESVISGKRDRARASRTDSTTAKIKLVNGRVIDLNEEGKKVGSYEAEFNRLSGVVQDWRTFIQYFVPEPPDTSPELLGQRMFQSLYDEYETDTHVYYRERSKILKRWSKGQSKAEEVLRKYGSGRPEIEKMRQMIAAFRKLSFSGEDSERKYKMASKEFYGEIRKLARKELEKALEAEKEALHGLLVARALLETERGRHTTLELAINNENTRGLEAAGFPHTFVKWLRNKESETERRMLKVGRSILTGKMKEEREVEYDVSPNNMLARAYALLDLYEGKERHMRPAGYTVWEFAKEIEELYGWPHAEVNFMELGAILEESIPNSVRKMMDTGMIQKIAFTTMQERQAQEQSKMEQSMTYMEFQKKRAIEKRQRARDGIAEPPASMNKYAETATHTVQSVMDDEQRKLWRGGSLAANELAVLRVANMDGKRGRELSKLGAMLTTNMLTSSEASTYVIVRARRGVRADPNKLMMQIAAQSTEQMARKKLAALGAENDPPTADSVQVKAEEAAMSRKRFEEGMLLRKREHARLAEDIVSATNEFWEYRKREPSETAIITEAIKKSEEPSKVMGTRVFMQKAQQFEDNIKAERRLWEQRLEQERLATERERRRAEAAENRPSMVVYAPPPPRSTIVQPVIISTTSTEPPPPIKQRHGLGEIWHGVKTIFGHHKRKVPPPPPPSTKVIISQPVKVSSSSGDVTSRQLTTAAASIAKTEELRLLRNELASLNRLTRLSREQNIRKTYLESRIRELERMG